MDFIHLNQIVGRVGAGRFFRKGMEESLQFVFFFSFAYSVSFLDPESSLREDLQSTSKGFGEAYFPGSPGSETGLWSPNIPELLGTSGSEACRPDGNLGGCWWCCCCSTESALFCVCFCSVSVSLSSSPAKFPSGRVSVRRRTGEVSLDLFGAFSGPGL